jgi:hypothetical protein
MQDFVEPTLDPCLYWERFLDKVFIGRRQLRMQQTWSRNVKTVRSVLDTRKNLVSNTINSTYLAIVEMGPRFVRTTPTSTWKLKICRGSGGIFLKVDRS